MNPWEIIPWSIAIGISLIILIGPILMVGAAIKLVTKF